MSYNIIVCIKQVPHPEYLDKVSVNPLTGTINREGVPSVINPVDLNALEEALVIREKFSGRVSVITMGPPQARKVLENTLAIGADRAIHLSDRFFAGADTLATARALAYGIERLGQFDIILCGDTSLDSGTGQVAVQLAVILSLPCITNVEEISFDNKHNLLVKQVWELGYTKLRMKLPGVIAVTRKINQPRLPNILGIMSAAQKEIIEWAATDICRDVGSVGLNGSPTHVLQVGEFHAKRQGEIYRGTPEEVTTLAIDRLMKQELI
jgi:electron transfer flavoprotein beta subunit